ncbi:MAG: hypothetical protein KF910_11915 [Brevundimonas sp.]|uniref:hypothetical protein n=1 Tax=Brevundimonas sp. TaxID=1871086 RepID=UPI0025C233FE|nr:hypothetical protein [Brevundimonas sp.]MBX3478309.1 hypothetical protein [Brevundimonas sp.]
MTVASFMMAVVVVLTPGAFYDPRLLSGADVWAKPLKFALSLALHFITLAILAQLLRPEVRTDRSMSRLVRVSVAAALFEIAYIAFQAARGRPSHFNFDTPFETGMYALMGIGATSLVVIPFLLGLRIHRQRDGDRSAYRLGAMVGLLLAPILTLVVAGYMSGVAYDRWVGDGVGASIPLLGWSRVAGDFRPAHFIGLHAMQVLPLVGWIADRTAPAQARRIVWLSAVLMVVTTIALFAQALAGQPLWPL